MIPLSLADLRLAARLLSEAAAALSRTATTPREAEVGEADEEIEQ